MRFLAFFVLSVVILNMPPSYANQPTVNLYSAQKEHLIRPLLDMFTQETGIAVNIITAKPAALLTRLEHEGSNSPADVLLTADIGNIIQARKKGLLQPVSSEILSANIPSHLRGEDNRWFAFTKRIRALFVRKDSDVQPAHYLDITGDAYSDGILVRSSGNIYNQSLMGYMIHHHGKEKALVWATGLVENLARAPQGGDRDQIKALATGAGKVAIANSYYYGILLGGDPSLQHEATQENISIIFPNQDSIGAHVNVRGGGLVTHAPNKAQGVALLEFLSTPQAQRVFADSNFEYPVHPDVTPSPLLASWGDVKTDDTPLATIASHYEDALALIDAAGWK